MGKQYVIDKGKMSFGSKLSKEYWQLKSNIEALKATLKLDSKNLNPTQLALIKMVIRNLSNALRKMERELIKQGEMTKQK